MAPLPTVEGPIPISNGTVKVEDGETYKDQSWQWFELSYNTRKLKYTVSIFGNQPESGYPLFIGLHGGGEDKTGEGNDSSWYDASTRYFYEPLQKRVADSSANGAVLIVPRGVSIRDPKMPKAKGDLIDTSDLHSQPESYVLWEQLVKNFLLMKELPKLGQECDKYAGQLNPEAKQLVDPDRIYLLGYSAGGDGAFQLGARMPDRFAAVSAGGRHPNGVKFDNVANLPICLQNGELDSGPDRYWRAKINVETDGILNKLYQDLGVIEEDYYRHECFIVKGRSHDGWHQPDEIERSQGVLSNLSAWYTNAGAIGARFMVSKDLNPLRWLSNYSRNPTPPLVI
jgi:dienelactone hydrolase